jgi:hypothetical protein
VSQGGQYHCRSTYTTRAISGRRSVLRRSAIKSVKNRISAPFTVLSLLDDKILQSRLRGQGCSVVRKRCTVALECHAIPHERGGGDVLQVGALFEVSVARRLFMDDSKPSD